MASTILKDKQKVEEIAEKFRVRCNELGQINIEKKETTAK